MNLIHAVILGIVEGITEFLPISSTGHLILASALLGLPGSAFVKSFEISIQLGAILSVVVLYARKLVMDRETMKKIIVAFLPTGIIGFLLYRLIKHYLMGSSLVVIVAMAVGGILLIVIEMRQKNAPPGVATISYRQAFLIGVAQSLAVVPGVSRSAATILGGLALGVERKAVVEFSFLLAVPTMMAATGLDLLKTGASFKFAEIELLAAGFVVSFVVALLSIKFLLRFIQTHTFIPFGIYRIAAAILFALLLL
jgi:undecaprenyl-diphosphatase